MVKNVTQRTDKKQVVSAITNENRIFVFFVSLDFTRCRLQGYENEFYVIMHSVF
jgi:hypothetical protein